MAEISQYDQTRKAHWTWSTWSTDVPLKILTADHMGCAIQLYRNQLMDALQRYVPTDNLSF